MIETLDDTIKSAEEIQKQFRAWRPGEPYRLCGSRTATQTHPYRSMIHSAFKEAFLVLRTNLQYTLLDRPLRSLVCTSTDAGEGKSLTSYMLAVAMAQIGRQVILVDADLRKSDWPPFADFNSRTGLTSLLVNGDLQPGTVLRAGDVPGLRILPGPPIPPNPSELLGSARMKVLLEKLVEDADRHPRCSAGDGSGGRCGPGGASGWRAHGDDPR